MAIAGIQQAVINHVGVNKGQGSLVPDGTPNNTPGLALVAPVEKTSVDEGTIVGIENNSELDIRLTDTRFEFSIHEGTEAVMVKVIDTETDEIIREIPPEKILDMVAKMWELAGILVDKRA